MLKLQIRCAILSSILVFGAACDDTSGEADGGAAIDAAIDAAADAATDAATSDAGPTDSDGGPGDTDGGPDASDGGPSGTDGGPDAGPPVTAADFLSYLGGTSQGEFSLGAVRDVETDAAGNVYAAGGISVTGYGTSGAAQTTYGGGTSDAFVASFTPSGTLRFFTYLGGANHDRAYALLVDAMGITISGRAGDGFPTTSGAAQTGFSGGPGGPYGTQDGFVARLSLDGSRWEWVTYLGGPSEGVCREVDVDASGQAWCAMIGIHAAVPGIDSAPNGFDRTYNGGGEMGLLRLSADGSTLNYATYIGGSGNEVGAASVRVTSDQGVWFVASTESDDAPVTSDAYQSTRGGEADVLLMRFDRNGARVYGTYYGGSRGEAGETHNLAVAPDDSPVIGMYTSGTDLPDALNANPGSDNGFVARFTPDGRTLVAARYIGGGANDDVEGIDTDGTYIVVTGGTNSGDFPVTAGAAFSGRGSDFDGFVHVLSLDLSSVIYSTAVPASGFTFSHGVRFGPGGTIVHGGSTAGLDLPVSAGAFESTPGSGIPRSGAMLTSAWDAGFVGLIVLP